MKINRVLSVSQCYKFTLYCTMVFKLRYILQQMKINYRIRWRFFFVMMDDRNFDYIVIFDDRKIEQMKIKDQADITFSSKKKSRDFNSNRWLMFRSTRILALIVRHITYEHNAHVRPIYCALPAKIIARCQAVEVELNRVGIITRRSRVCLWRGLLNIRHLLHHRCRPFLKIVFILSIIGTKCCHVS